MLDTDNPQHSCPTETTHAYHLNEKKHIEANIYSSEYCLHLNGDVLACSFCKPALITLACFSLILLSLDTLMEVFLFLPGQCTWLALTLMQFLMTVYINQAVKSLQNTVHETCVAYTECPWVTL